MILKLAESRSAVTQILQFEEKSPKKKSPGASVLDKIIRPKQLLHIQP